MRLPPLDYVYHMFYTSFPSMPEVVLDLEENQESNWVSFTEALSLPLIAGGKEALIYYKNFASYIAKKNGMN